jgi:hypothetical protein
MNCTYKAAAIQSIHQNPIQTFPKMNTSPKDNSHISADQWRPESEIGTFGPFQVEFHTFQLAAGSEAGSHPVSVTSKSMDLACRTGSQLEMSSADDSSSLRVPTERTGGSVRGRACKGCKKPYGQCICVQLDIEHRGMAQGIQKNRKRTGHRRISLFTRFLSTLITIVTD